ncbi:MAG: hypothetical protein ACOYMG_20530 [Candidatus Methylumidiphilus sp.]
MPADFVDKLKSARPTVADICKIFIVLGFILDGTLSWRERSQLSALNKQGFLNLSFAELENYRRQFVDGQGLDGVIQDFLATE